jgi:Uncharacterized conserved protein
MEISFIGAGKAALSLSKYFSSKGHNIKYIFDIEEQKSKDFAQELGCKSADIDTIIKNSKIVFLTVNDSSIYNLWNQITNKMENSEIIFIHCSGAKEGIYAKQNLYALHPACAMTGDGDLNKICFGLENTGDKVDFIKSFIEEMGNRVILISKDKKREYHLANVMVSNLVLSIIDRAVSYLKNANLNEEEALALLIPLAKQNILNIESNGILKSITGPVAREDFEVLKNHLEIMQEEDKSFYKYLSQNILNILGKNIDINTKI